MISLKEWNSFDNKTRSIILDYLVFPTMVNSKLEQGYHHNFDYDNYGRHLKKVLSNCYKQKDGKINVVIEVLPTYAPKTQVSKPVVKKQQEVKYCEYCGKEIEDTNNTGSLCHRCYMKEYYPEEQDL